MELKLQCGLKFPFLHKAFQILQSIVPEGELSAKEELMFVLRAYGKAVSGQNIAIEDVDDAVRKNLGGYNTLCGYVAYLNYGDSQATTDPMGRKWVGIIKFNAWLAENGFPITVEANPKYQNGKGE